jgi:hypothetical protein
MGEEPSDMELAPGQRLRAVYHQNNHGPQGAIEPTIEEFQSITRALDEFAGRARFQRGLVREAGRLGPPEPTHWPDGDDTAFMDVWLVDPADDQEPGIPDAPWQRWTWGDDGQIHRQDI